jgi:hypothetical protein
MNSLQVRGSRTWTNEDEQWEKAAGDYATAALPRVRASAERWVAGLGALLAALGVGAIVKGSERFDELVSGARSAGKFFFMVAIAAALLAFGLAAWASVVTSKRLFIPAGPAIREATEKAVESAVKKLRCSLIAFSVSLVSLLASASFLIYGHKVPPMLPDPPAACRKCEAANTSTRAEAARSAGQYSRLRHH